MWIKSAVIGRKSVILQGLIMAPMVKLKRNYTDSTQFDNGILPWGKALATSLQWLYDDEEFEDDSISEEEYDRNMLYYMDGILPIYDFMSLVADVIYMAFRDFGEPDIKNYLNLLQDIETGKWGNNKPRLQYDGDFMILGEVSTWTTEVILWSAYLYCHIRREFEPENERAVRADKLLYKLYARQTCLMPELVKNTFLMKHFKKTELVFLKNRPTDHGKQGKNGAEGRARDALPTIDMINAKPQLIESLGEIVAQKNFEYNFLKQVFAQLDERLMDKAILVISGKWYWLIDQKDERCYQAIGSMPYYGFDQRGMYEKEHQMKMLKYLDIERDLENLRKDELKRRKVNRDFEQILSPSKKKPKNTTPKKRNRNPRNKNKFTKSTFTCKDLKDDQFMKERKSVLCDLLFEHFVASKEEKRDIEKDKIGKLFSGKPLNENEKLTWKGAKKELAYFFRQLRKHLEYSSNLGFWDIVASHFVIETEGKKIVQGKKKVRLVSISADSLQSTTGKPKKDIMQKLDYIINILTAPIAEVLQLHKSDIEEESRQAREREMAEKAFANEQSGKNDYRRK